MGWLKTVLKMFTDARRNVERGFFSLWFKTTEEDYTKGDLVEIDVERTTNVVAPTLRDPSTGAVIVKSDSWKENKFRPPYTALEDPIAVNSLLQRQPGETDDAKQVGTWFGRLANKVVKSLARFHRMIGLNVDLQCAQIMQTGEVTLKDDKNGTTYKLNFGAAVSHFPTVAISWGTSGATPVDDVAALADRVADDGQVAPAYLILGDNAWKNLLKDTTFQSLVRKDGLGLGVLQPSSIRARGGKYHGICDFGSHTLEIWTYGGTYYEIGSNVPKKYLDTNAAIVTADPDNVDFRTVYAGIVDDPEDIDRPFDEIVPRVVTFGDSANGEGFIQVHDRVYHDKNRKTWIAESSARPLSIPVSIDRFGCLKTQTA